MYRECVCTIFILRASHSSNFKSLNNQIYKLQTAAFPGNLVGNRTEMIAIDFSFQKFVPIHVKVGRRLRLLKEPPFLPDSLMCRKELGRSVVVSCQRRPNQSILLPFSDSLSPRFVRFFSPAKHACKNISFPIY